MVKTFQALAIVASLALFFYVLSVGISRSERAECYTWRDQAADFPAFYMLAWQTAQCEHHGINVWQK